MTLLHDFSSWLFFITFLHNSLSNSLHSFSSWLSIIAFYHSFLSKLSTKQSSCSSLCFSSCFSSCFSLWLSIKKIMQKGNAKTKNRKNLVLLTSYSISWWVKSRTQIKYWLEVDIRSSQNVETEYLSWVRRLILST